METTTIAIIDDHKIVRQGLKELLQRLGSYEVIHEFEDGEAFLRRLALIQSATVVYFGLFDAQQKWLGSFVGIGKTNRRVPRFVSHPKF